MKRFADMSLDVHRHDRTAGTVGHFEHLLPVAPIAFALGHRCVSVADDPGVGPYPIKPLHGWNRTHGARIVLDLRDA